MARPRSEERRSQILSAATRVVAARGLGAATAAIASEAGVSNGSLFLYFDSKATLVNELYLSLKADMGDAVMAGMPNEADVRAQLQHVWASWLRWATAFPEKRRALAQLDVSDDVAAESHARASILMRPLAVVLEEARANGPLAEQPLGFVLAISTAVIESTVDAIIREPNAANSYSAAGFDAMWRLLTSSTGTESE